VLETHEARTGDSVTSGAVSDSAISSFVAPSTEMGAEPTSCSAGGSAGLLSESSIEIVALVGATGSTSNVVESQSHAARRKNCVPQTSVTAPKNAQNDLRKRFSDTPPIALRYG